MVVDNRGGGAGVPAMLAGKAATPDGYTLIMATTGTLSITPFLYANPPYDPLKDFIPVSNVIVAPLVITAHPSVTFRTVPELVAAAKKAPGKLMYASPGQGTSQHFTAELFATRAGIKLAHIPYKGSGPAIVDLMGGQVLLMFDSVPSSLPHLKSGRIRAIAVTTCAAYSTTARSSDDRRGRVSRLRGGGLGGHRRPCRHTARDLVERISAAIRDALKDRNCTVISSREAGSQTRDAQSLWGLHPKRGREMDAGREGSSGPAGAVSSSIAYPSPPQSP